MTKYLVQQRYQSSWVTEEECSDIADARNEVSRYRIANQGRTKLRIVKKESK